MARNSSRVITDHDEIRRWAEERDASPACVRRTGGGGDIGMIRLDFPGYTGEQSLEHIDWDEWFQKFDESNLALLVQDQLVSGERSNFNKLIGRETAKRRSEGDYRASRHEGGKRTGSSRSTSRRSASAPSGSRRRAASSARSSVSQKSGGARRKAAKSSASSSRSSSARAKRARTSSDRSDRAARTKRTANSRTRSSGASSRARTTGGTASRSKTQRGSQRAIGNVTRRSGTAAGRNRARAGTGRTAAAAGNTGSRSAKRNPDKVVKAAKKIKQRADNIIRMEKGRGSRGPSRVTKRASAKTTGGTARQTRSRSNPRNKRKAA